MVMQKGEDGYVKGWKDDYKFDEFVKHAAQAVKKEIKKYMKDFEPPKIQLTIEQWVVHETSIVASKLQPLVKFFCSYWLMCRDDTKHDVRK